MEKSTIQIAFEHTQELIEHFEAGIGHYLSPNYQEAEVRKEYIDKFYAALGWDVNHDRQKNPFAQEVKIEKAQRQQGGLGQKRADYAFFLEPNFKQELFFVEAKKPSRTLRQNKDDYFQTAKYGWNAGTGVSILTDFEEIVIIDCRFRPDFDTILQSEIKYYKYKDFQDFDTFEEFYWLFSREALLAGNLATYIEQLKKPKGTGKQLKLFGGKYQSIDESFLNYIDAKRFELATAFYQNNRNLDAYELTEATQRTIDRIVFIRFLEDKLIETENIIHNIATANHPWAKFVEYSKHLETKYNGIVFKPLFIDDKKFGGANDDLFRALCSDLDHTNTPYDFNYIPIHILGSIYERFLGKIVVVENGRVTIELKPELRKAGGVFYTPKYIVDYIVKNTVGKLIEDKTPKQIAELTIADIACGSGSFLIGVFEYLLDYHNKWYNENPITAKKDGCKFNEDFGVYVLSIQQKQKILLNNIYGVDIDLQATEVTQLSLFLKMLEDETTSTANDMMVLFHEKILPNLTTNIKCGNSLIGTDILTSKLDLDLEQERKLNPFDFKLAFSRVFKKGGFDSIVGNPPYVNVENIDDISKKYYFKKFSTCKGRTDLYIAFIEKSVGILKENGLYSVIIPFSYTNQTYGNLSRKLLIEKYHLSEIVDISKYYVFKEAVVKTMILLVENKFSKKLETKVVKANDVSDFQNNSFATFNILQNTFLNNKENRFETKPLKDFITVKEKLLKNSIPLENLCLIAYGARLNHKTEKIGKNYFIKKDYHHSYKPFTEGKNIERYNFSQNAWLNYQPEIHYNSMFPELFESEKLMFINVVSDRLRFCYDNQGFYNSHTVINCVKIENLKSATHISAKKIFNKKTKINFKDYGVKYILGIVNSNIINWYFLNYLSENLHFYPNDAKSLPIPKLTKENQQTHDTIVYLVEQMLATKKQQQTAVTERDKSYLEGKCRNLDSQINELVYQLYNLTDDEIAIIENA